MMTLEKEDGLPVAGLEARVDAVGVGRHVGQQILIAVDIGAAGSANLDKGEAPLVGRVELEKEFDGAKTLENAFCVVDAIDADSEKRGADAELTAQRGALFIHAAMRLEGMAVFLKSNADGIGEHTGQVSLAIHGEAVPFRERYDSAIDGGKKIVAMGLNVKADEIGAEQPVNQFALPGADAEDFGIRPGNVPEDGDASVRPGFLDHARQQREMIILDEDDGGLSAFHLRNGRI